MKFKPMVVFQKYLWNFDHYLFFAEILRISITKFLLFAHESINYQASFKHRTLRAIYTYKAKPHSRPGFLLCCTETAVLTSLKMFHLFKTIKRTQNTTTD
jgi:hypothetical protein